jgi:hypothetical protein
MTYEAMVERHIDFAPLLQKTLICDSLTKISVILAFQWHHLQLAIEVMTVSEICAQLLDSFDSL